MAEEDDLKNMASQVDTHGHLDLLVILGPHDQGKDAEHEGHEPHTEPVDVVLAVVKVVENLSLSDTKSNSISN